MRAEPWMNRTPIPRKTPLELARSDLRYWLDRIRSLNADLMAAEKEVSAAMDRVEKLERT